VGKYFLCDASCNVEKAWVQGAICHLEKGTKNEKKIKEFF
jgi:hypothetical protein